LIRFTGQENTYTICGAISFVGGLGFAAFFYIEQPSLWIVLVPAALFGLAFGTMVPIGLKGALTAFKQQSGSASALYGCLTLGASGLFSAFAGVGLDMDFRALNVLAAICGVCCMLILLTTILSRSKIK
jgi:MFS family permease